MIGTLLLALAPFANVAPPMFSTTTLGDTSSPCARSVPVIPPIEHCPEESPGYAACLEACRVDYETECQDDIDNACAQATALVQDYLAGNITMPELSAGIASANADLNAHLQANGAAYQWCAQQCCGDNVEADVLAGVAWQAYEWNAGYISDQDLRDYIDDAQATVPPK